MRITDKEKILEILEQNPDFVYYLMIEFQLWILLNHLTEKGAYLSDFPTPSGHFYIFKDGSLRKFTYSHPCVGSFVRLLNKDFIKESKNIELSKDLKKLYVYIVKDGKEICLPFERRLHEGASTEKLIEASIPPMEEYF